MSGFQADKRELISAYERMVDWAAGQKAEPVVVTAPRYDRRLLVIGLLCTMSVASWLVAPPPREMILPVDPPIVVESGFRVALYLTAQQVEAHRTTAGRLPERIEEVSGHVPGVVYRRLDDVNYELSVTDGASVTVFHSSQDPREFLGDAPARIAGSPVATR